MSSYRGRFAPSPTGPLHLGSLVAAMASYLDARVHQGQWLVRIEDLDFDRNVQGADTAILHTLQRCGMHWNEEVVWQNERTQHYQAALQTLAAHVFPCGCSRKEIADSRVRAGLQDQQIYPGTCRIGLASGKPARSYRLRVPDGDAAVFKFEDRFLGKQSQNIATEVGDFVLKRADGFWAYQLAVVVDDALQDITHIVRGSDLLDSTARQIYLQTLLAINTPTYLHLPVVLSTNGEKLSKQTGAVGFDRGDNDLLKEALIPAADFLELHLARHPIDIPDFWNLASEMWQHKLSEKKGHEIS